MRGCVDVFTRVVGVHHASPERGTTRILILWHQDVDIMLGETALHKFSLRNHDIGAVAMAAMHAQTGNEEPSTMATTSRKLGA